MKRLQLPDVPPKERRIIERAIHGLLPALWGNSKWYAMRAFLILMGYSEKEADALVEREHKAGRL